MLDMLQRDREFYESQDKKMRMKINNLARQMEEVKKESTKYKRLLEEMQNNRINPNDLAKIAHSMGISTNAAHMINEFKFKKGLDSSMDIDSMTDSSCYLSSNSSFSYESKERSCSNDLRASFDSNMEVSSKGSKRESKKAQPMITSPSRGGYQG